MPSGLSISYKPQIFSPKFEGTVKDLLYTKFQDAWKNKILEKLVFNPLKIKELLNHEVKSLSGGQLQRVAIMLALAKPCDIYLIDEPSAYLD